MKVTREDIIRELRDEVDSGFVENSQAHSEWQFRGLVCAALLELLISEQALGDQDEEDE